MNKKDKRMRLDITEDNITFMKTMNESASVIINKLLNSAREAQETMNEEFHSNPKLDH